MLLRLNYLGSITRHEWWKSSPPIAIHVLSKRPSFTGTGTDATDYGWFAWDKTDRIKRGIFLSVSKFLFINKSKYFQIIINNNI